MISGVTRHAPIIVAVVVGLFAMFASPSTALGPRPAHASVSIAMSLKELVKLSDSVVVAKASTRRSLWEQQGSGRRIVTYTKLQIEQRIFGQPISQIWVRTLGGAVGKIGQHVSGEPQFGSDSRSLLFLARAPDGAWVVTGRAQGHFPIVGTKKTGLHLEASPDVGTLLPRRKPSTPARDALVGSSPARAISKIRQAKARRDAAAKK